MLFGLCNGPVSWQHFINNTLFHFLHCFVQTYLDNIFIYGKRLKKHYFHICQVLQCLQKAGLQVDINKYKFHFKEKKFFCLIVFTESI